MKQRLLILVRIVGCKRKGKNGGRVAEWWRMPKRPRNSNIVSTYSLSSLPINETLGKSPLVMK